MPTYTITIFRTVVVSVNSLNIHGHLSGTVAEIFSGSVCVMANYTVTVTRKYSYKKQANRTLQQRRDDEDVLLFNNNNGN